MKSKWSILLEMTVVYRWLFILLLPLYFYAEQHIEQRDINFLFYLFTLLLSALSFRRVWLQAISSGLLSYMGHVSELNLHMFLFHWFSSFVISTLIMTMIEKYLNEKRNTIDLIDTLANSLDSRDEYTAFHSHNVAQYSKRIAEEMKLPQRVCENIYFGGLLHDIGKIGIPENILNKPSKLTEEEYHLIKQHPVTGFNLVKHIDRFKHSGILNMILCHHERYDGIGYPRGLEGKEIPLEARIIAVADTFDAMTSKRIYREQQVNWKDALDEIRQNKGTQFDPHVVNAFLNIAKYESFQLNVNQDNQTSTQKNLNINNRIVS